MTGGYDDGYKSCPCFWGGSPASLLQNLTEFISDFRGLSALDAGCGEGKNTAFLRDRGAAVRSIDISPHALKNAKAAWPSIPSEQWEQGDVRCMDFPPDSMDIVLAYGLFHCFSNHSEITDVIHRLQSATRPGGYHIVCAFNSRLQELHAHPALRPCLLPHETYLDFYRRWEILVQSDTDLREVHPHNGISHRHALTRIIARKAIAP